MKIVKRETECLPRSIAAKQPFEPSRQSGHLWCIHCERAYTYGDYRQVGISHLCPYRDCLGAAAFAWDWLRVRKVNPSYPREPSPGVVYPLFGKGMYTRRLRDRSGIER